MQRPTWVVVIGIFMILIGGCSGFDNYFETKTSEVLEERDSFVRTITINDDNEELDLEHAEIDSSDEGFLRSLSDTIVRDSSNKVNVKATLEEAMKFSPYRIKWMERFGYIGLAVAILFIIAGVLFLTSRKFTIPFALVVLAISLLVGIFELFVYKADFESGTAITKFSDIGIYWSIFVDIILLVTIMVLDKSYFNNSHHNQDDSYPTV